MIPLSGEVDDGVVTEDPVLGKVGADSVKKFGLGGAIGDEVGPADGDRLSVGRRSSANFGDGTIVTLDCFVRRGSVLFVLRTVALPEVVSAGVKISPPVPYSAYVGRAAVEVEDGGVALPFVREA